MESLIYLIDFTYTQRKLVVLHVTDASYVFIVSRTYHKHIVWAQNRQDVWIRSY